MPLVSTENATAIPTRRISFEEGLAELPRHFADDDLITSHFVAALSSVFPDGEDFFVRSVRHYRDRIADPGLRTAVKGFIGQESVHGREHRRLNARLAELGYPSQRVERFVQRGLEMRSRIAPPISNLAATAAMEHFTATLAEQAQHAVDLGFLEPVDLTGLYALDPLNEVLSARGDEAVSAG